MWDAGYLRSKHKAGRPYAEYATSGTDQQTADWKRVYDQTQLTEDQKALAGSFVRKINVIAVSGIWCGDCVLQGPLLARIADANPARIDLRWLDRDDHSDLADHLTINAGKRVPVAIFCAEDYEPVGWYGDRTLSRYRALAEQQLGASCPMPGAPVAQQDMAAILQDWLNEFERVHLLLRLSTRLRQLHED